MSNRGYQRLAQSEEADVGEGLPRPVAHTTLRRPSRPGHIDLSKLDNAFKRSATATLITFVSAAEMSHLLRWTDSIAQKVRRKKKVEDHSKKEILRSVFDPPVVGTPMNVGPVSLSVACLCQEAIQPIVFLAEDFRP
jgi:phosphatidylinositol 4-kinase type 2